MQLKMDYIGRLFRKEPERIYLAKYPALIRIAPYAPIIFTEHIHNESNGNIILQQKQADNAVSVDPIKSLNLAYHIMAMDPHVLYAWSWGHDIIAYCDSDGSIAYRDFELNTIGGLFGSWRNSLPNPKFIGYAKTRVQYLGPSIEPYRLYADESLTYIYTGALCGTLPVKPDILTEPDMTMYRSLVEHEDAEYVISINGEYQFVRG